MIPDTVGAVLAVSVGYEHTCAIRQNPRGEAFCWGIYDTFDDTIPSDLGPVNQISAGGDGRTCAVRMADSRTQCWGSWKTNGEINLQAAPGAFRSACERGLRSDCITLGFRNRALLLADRRVL